MKRIIALILTAVTVAALSGTVSAVSEYEDLNSFGNAKVAYGMGVELDAENRPLGAVTAQNQYGEMGAFFIGDSTEKRLWLTFDEGYENGYTSDLQNDKPQRPRSQEFMCSVKINFLHGLMQLRCSSIHCFLGI